jgi:S-adenosylhomocysteine hydrolase
MQEEPEDNRQISRHLLPIAQERDHCHSSLPLYEASITDCLDLQVSCISQVRELAKVQAEQNAVPLNYLSSTRTIPSKLRRKRRYVFRY